MVQVALSRRASTFFQSEYRAQSLVRFRPRRRWKSHRTGRKTLRFERRVLSLEAYRRAGTASAPSVFLFWPANLLRRRRQEDDDHTAHISCSICLFQRKRNRSFGGEKRMPRSTVHPQWQILLRYRLPQPIWRLGGTKQVLQRLDCSERHLPYSTGGITRRHVLPVRGVYGLSVLPHPEAAEAARLYRSRSPRLYSSQFCFSSHQGAPAVSKLCRYPMLSR